MASRRSQRGASAKPACQAEVLQEVNDVFRELSSRERVRGVIATTTQGATIKSTLKDDQATAKYTQLAANLCEQVRNAGENDEPLYFKVKTRRQEILIVPSKKYTLVMIADEQQQDDQK